MIRPARLERIEILPLPSTSPANASIPRTVKLERWREMLRWSTPQGGKARKRVSSSR
jgi:G:T/U-mismatch repair DNA glycosylase